MENYSQIVKNGVLLKTRRSNRVPNEIILYDDYAEVVLYKNNIECARAKISLDKVSEVKKHKWHYLERDRSCYAKSHSAGRMHNFLYPPPEGLVCDHINNNGLDNRKENIRHCTQQQNSFNVLRAKNCISGCRGVYWNPASNKWRARIKVNGKPIEIGSFKELNDAIKARIEAEKRYFGEYAPEHPSDITE